MSSALPAITDATFAAQVERQPGLVIVDCWAPWCGPCKALAPVLEALALEFTGRVTFLALNVDQNPQSAQRYGVRALPTLLAFRDGQPVAQIAGAQSRAALSQRFGALLG